MGLTQGIYIITGIMASGKSTVAQLLAESADKSVHVRGDLFRRMIVTGRADITNPLTDEAIQQLRLRYKLAAQVAEDYYAAGFTVIVQDNFLGKEAHHFLSLLTMSPVYFITLCPSVRTVVEREAARNKAGYVNHWDVQSLHDVLIGENPRIGLWIDSSDQTPEETVCEIIQRYEAEARIQ